MKKYIKASIITLLISALLCGCTPYDDLFRGRVPGFIDKNAPSEDVSDNEEDISDNEEDEASEEDVTDDENEEEVSEEIPFEDDIEEEFMSDDYTDPMPFDDTVEFVFTSGVGSWSTGLKVNSDGSFEGIYTDSDMGISGEDYPGGTCYICEFTGKFSPAKRINDYSYTMHFEEMWHKYPIGKEWIDNGIRYIASKPYGLEDSTEFILYSPNTPVNELNEEFLGWWHGESQGLLGNYAICNPVYQNGFFSYD